MGDYKCYSEGVHYRHYLMHSLRKQGGHSIVRICLIVLFSLFLLYFLFIGAEYYSNSFLRRDVSSLIKFKTRTQIDQCLDLHGIGCATSAGIGNVVFEALTYIALLEKTDRKPILIHEGTRKRLSQVIPHFPQLNKLLSVEAMSGYNCQNYTEEIGTGGKCCVFNSKMVKEIVNSSVPTVRAKLWFAQSFKYFQKLGMEKIRYYLDGSEKAKERAEKELFSNPPNETEKHICVHIRRGDFLKQKLSMPGFENFTVPAVALLAHKYHPSHVYIFGNDHKFNMETFANFSYVSVAKYFDKGAINAEWEFSERYCDVSLLTASVSTYGWFMAYLARGHDVYFNFDYSLPNGISKQLHPDDFWPPSWVPLQLQLNGTIAIRNRADLK